MKIVNVRGGLGNQMFQYAFGRSLSIELGEGVLYCLHDYKKNKFHNGFEIQDIFDIHISEASKYELKELFGVFGSPRILNFLSRNSFFNVFGSKILNEDTKLLTKNLNKINNSILFGYWQSDEYFSFAKEVIRSDFTFKKPLNEINSNLIKVIANSNSVSIHIRRGDYLSSGSNGSIHYIQPREYYETAIEILNSKLLNPVYYFFSDDMKWVRENIKSPKQCVYIDHNIGPESYVDMQLMAACKHNIIANSSFSWWGAWLNDNPEKIVIAPKNWFIDKRPTCGLVPSTWINV